MGIATCTTKWLLLINSKIYIESQCRYEKFEIHIWL